MAHPLQALRDVMAEYHIDAYLIPTADFHGSEYVGAHFACREYLSGFTGSAGTLLVFANWAGLWTDGRYFLQAAQQLEGSGIRQAQPSAGPGGRDLAPAPAPLRPARLGIGRAVRRSLPPGQAGAASPGHGQRGGRYLPPVHPGRHRLAAEPAGERHPLRPGLSELSHPHERNLYSICQPRQLLPGASGGAGGRRREPAPL